jgi:hypothetical protein
MTVKCNWPFYRCIRLPCVPLHQPNGRFREVLEAIAILTPVEIRAPLRPAQAFVRVCSSAGLACRHLGIRLAQDLWSEMPTSRHEANRLQPIDAAIGCGSGSGESTSHSPSGVVNPFGIHRGNPCKYEGSL